MSKLHEQKPVEAKVTEWLSMMGWKPKTAEDLKPYNRLQMDAVIVPILVEKVMALNDIKEKAAVAAVDLLLNNLRNPSPIEGNENFLNQLVDGVTMTIDKEDKTMKIFGRTVLSLPINIPFNRFV